MPACYTAAMARSIVLRAVRLLALLAFSGLSLCSLARDGIPKPVAQALKAAGIAEDHVAILVKSVDGHGAALSINADRAMNPASVMKLLTTYAALDMLGPAYRWTTEAYASAAPVDGVLDGDLYLRGNGDPRFTLEEFWLLLRQLRARGVREIRGDLVLDRSAFALREEDMAIIDDQPWRPYNVPPDALLVNFRALRLTLLPDVARQRLDLVVEPELGDIALANQIRLGDGACGEWKDGLRASFSAVPARLLLSGSYPAACGEQEWNLGLLPAALFAEETFRALWRELGGSLRGRVREGALPAAARLVVSHDSATLAEVVRDINKFSNNVMARQLYLSLGLAAGHRPVAPADAESVLRAWLAGKKLDLPELVLENGAGLSRRERISANSLAELLGLAWNSPFMPEFAASLPLAGIDGTMKKRLKETAVAGQARIKTGTLTEVKTMAGYLRDKSGRERIVVFLVNDLHAEAAQAAQDALLTWVFEHPGMPPRPGPRAALAESEIP